MPWPLLISGYAPFDGREGEKERGKRVASLLKKKNPGQRRGEGKEERKATTAQALASLSPFAIEREAEKKKGAATLH